MGEVTIIGVDLAKNVFQVHRAAASPRCSGRSCPGRSSFVSLPVAIEPQNR